MMFLGKMRGQAAVEFLAVVAFFLLITIPLFAYFYTSAPQKEYYASLSQGESAAAEFIKYGELVGTQSNGTRIRRLIVLPKYTEAVALNGSFAVLSIEYAGLNSDVARKGSAAFAEKRIEIPQGGTYAFTFENAEGEVNVSKE